MTSPAYQPPPDISSYVDLRVFDRTDQEIVESALALLAVNLPELTLREGHTETMLVESVALEASEVVTAINRLPGAVLEALLRFIGIFKDYGNAPTAPATITCADTMGHQIPPGTRLVLPANDGSLLVMLVESPGVEIPPGSAAGALTLICDSYTAAANGVPTGTALAMATPLPYVDSVTLTGPVTGGRDPESDDDWRDRGVNRLSRLSDTLVLPRHFYAAAMEDPNVARAVVVDNTDPATSGVGDDPGHVTVSVLGAGGAALTTEQRAVLEADLQAAAYAVLAVHVTGITITVLTMSVAVALSDASDPDAVTQTVEQAILDYLDPLTWSGGTTIRRNELISLVDQVAGVDYVSEVMITGADGSGNFVLPSASAVPDATSASVTVTVV